VLVIEHWGLVPIGALGPGKQVPDSLRLLGMTSRNNGGGYGAAEEAPLQSRMVDTGAVWTIFFARRETSPARAE